MFNLEYSPDGCGCQLSVPLFCLWRFFGPHARSCPWISRQLLAACESGSVAVVDPRLTRRVGLLEGHTNCCNVLHFWGSHKVLSGMTS